MNRLGWLSPTSNPDRIPVAMVSHSFGTFVAYESILVAQQKYSFKIAHMVSIAGITKEFLQPFPLYQGVLTEENFAEKARDTIFQMYNEIPYFWEDEYDPVMKAHAVEGKVVLC
jgi:hypothetical protein